MPGTSALLFLCLTVAWLLVLLAAPMLPATPSAIVYVFGSLVCHQLPERSFHIGAVQLPVCGRCLGIYAGLVVGAFPGIGPMARRSRPGLYRVARSARAVLIAGALPTLVSFTAEWLGVWDGTNMGRALAGVPLGLSIGLVVAAALATLHYDQCPPRPPIARDRPPSHI